MGDQLETYQKGVINKMNKGYVYKNVDAFTGNGSKGNPAAYISLHQKLKYMM